MRSKLVISLLVIAVAFLLATNSVVAGAAKQITGKQIKNSSVKSVDIKNNSLKLADLRKSTRQALRPPTYVFRIPAGGPSTPAKTFSFPGLPTGTYLATYSIVGRLNAAGTLACHLGASAASTAKEGYNLGHVIGSDSSPSSSAVLRIKASAPPILHCEALGASDWQVFPTASYRAAVTFTRVGAPTEATLAKGTPGR